MEQSPKSGGPQRICAGGVRIFMRIRTVTFAFRPGAGGENADVAWARYSPSFPSMVR